MTSLILSLVLLTSQPTFGLWASEQWQHYQDGNLELIETGSTGDWSVGWILTKHK